MVKPQFKIKKRIRLSPEAKMIIGECLLFLLSLALTPISIGFGIYPFGIAICASCKKYAPFALCASIISCIFFMDASVVYLVAFIVLLILRLLASLIKKPDGGAPLLGERRTKNLFSGLFEEGVSVRAFISLAVAFGIGLYFVIANGYQFYDIFSLAFFITITPVLTYALCGLWEEVEMKKSLLIALLALCFLVSFFLSGKEIAGIDFSILLSYALVLYISKSTSSLYACALGLVLGLSGEPAFAPIYALCALVSGLLWRVSTYLSIMCAFVLCAGYSILVGGYSGIAYLIPEILGASLIMFPLIRFELIPTPAVLSSATSEKSTTKEIELQIKNELSRQSLDNMSRAFSDISKIFYEVSKTSRAPSKKGAERMCLEICEGYCYLCPKGEICWKKDTETTEKSVQALGENVFFLGEAKKSSLDEKFVHRCPNVDKIIDKINTSCREFFRNGVKNDRLELSANSFELTSRLISASLDYDCDLERNLSLRSRISKLVCTLGIKCDKVEVFGIHKKRILLLGVDVLRSNASTEEIKLAIERELKIPLGEPIVEYNEDIASIEINELPLYKLTGEVKSLSLDKETNGDSAVSFKNDFDKEYFLLCDGMGSGQGAHITSSMCTSFLEKLLGVSKETEIALSMLNSFVRSKSVECSSSIDLLEVDVTTGDASFYKSGACSSFIKRGDKVFSLSSKTAPIGIMKRLDCQRLSFTFESGDICVMISDGVLGSKGDSGYLTSFLERTDISEPLALSNEILTLARERCDLKDDMSVFCIKFE